MYTIQRMEYGIHTLEISMKKLKYSQIQKVMSYLLRQAKVCRKNEREDGIDRSYRFQLAEKPGFSGIRIWQSASRSNGIVFQINASSLLTGAYQPFALLQPSLEN